MMVVLWTVRLSVVFVVQPPDDLVGIPGDDDITGHIFDDDRVYAYGHVVAYGHVANDWVERAVLADMCFRINDNRAPVPYRQTFATGVGRNLKASFIAQPAQSPSPIDMAEEIPAPLWCILVVFQMAECHDVLPDAVLV